MVSHHPAMFGDHWSGASEVIKCLILMCQMASQNHVIEESCNFMSGSS